MITHPPPPPMPPTFVAYPGETQSLRVHVPNNWVLGIWVMVVIVVVLGKYMGLRYLDP